MTNTGKFIQSQISFWQRNIKDCERERNKAAERIEAEMERAKAANDYFNADLIAQNAQALARYQHDLDTSIRNLVDWNTLAKLEEDENE